MLLERHIDFTYVLPAYFDFVDGAALFYVSVRCVIDSGKYYISMFLSIYQCIELREMSLWCVARGCRVLSVDVTTYNAIISSAATQRASYEEKWHYVLVWDMLSDVVKAKERTSFEMV